MGTAGFYTICRFRLACYGPYYPGISELPTVPEKMDGMTSAGRYKQMQKQRGIEREVRDKKRDIYNAELAGADVTQFRLELGKQQSRLKAHTEKYSLLREPRREKAYGIGAQPRALRSTIGTTRPKGTIGVEIDKFVACLEDRHGNILKTESIKLTSLELKGLNTRNGWYINWSIEAKAKEVYGLRLVGEKEIQGLVSLVDDPGNSAVKLGWVVSAPHNRGNNREYYGVGGHMFAIAANRSVELGYNGYMWGMAKTERLVRHYVERVGAANYDYLNFYIDEEAAKALLEKYNWTKA